MIKEGEKVTLFGLLRGVVALPVFRVLPLDCNRLSYSLRLTVVRVLALESDFNCVDMLAAQLPCFKVRAVATRRFRIGVDRVALWP